MINSKIQSAVDGSVELRLSKIQIWAASAFDIQLTFLVLAGNLCIKAQKLDVLVGEFSFDTCQN